MTDETLYGLMAQAEAQQATANAAIAKLDTSAAALAAASRDLSGVSAAMPEAVKAGVVAGLSAASSQAAEKIAAHLSVATREAQRAAESLGHAARWLNWLAIAIAFVVGITCGIGWVLWLDAGRDAQRDAVAAAVGRIEAYTSHTYLQTPEGVRENKKTGRR